MAFIKYAEKDGTIYDFNPRSVADQFSTSTAYAVGDYAYYNGTLYRFKAAHAAGAWNSAHVDEVTVASELVSHGTDISELKADLGDIKERFIYAVPANFSSASTKSGIITGANKWRTKSGDKSYTFSVTGLKQIEITAGEHLASLGVLSSSTLTVNQTPSFATGIDGRITVSSGQTQTINIPDDCVYIVIMKETGDDSYDFTPSSMSFLYFKDIPEIDNTLTVPGEAADAKVVGDALATKATKSDTFGSYVTETASGAVASFDDGADNVPVKDLVAQITPVQAGSGDPSPENVRPISGWTGVKVERAGENIWGGTLFRDGILGAIPGATYDDETIRVYANSTVNAAFTKASGLNDKFKENTVYTLILTGYNANSSSSSSNIRVNYTDGTYSTLMFPSTEATKQTLVFTTPADKTLRSISKTNQASYSVFYYNECGLFEGAITEQDFKPYIGNEYAISWETEAGTVYGGTLDVTSGVLSVDTAYREITEITRFYGNDPTGYAIVTLGAFGLVVNGSLICNMLRSAYPSSFNNEYIGQVLNSSGFNAAQITFRLSDALRGSNQDGTKANYDAYLQSLKDNGTPMTVAYKLSTPTTYQLTPQEVSTLLGINNIWVDTGDVSVDYRADTKLYIEKLTAPTEDDMVANNTIPDATYFMIGNNLYLSTTTIPAGDTINPGTNCTLMNLAAALNAINA